MSQINFNELLDAGVHFGHLKRKWNPHMAPYIFMEKNGIHIIDLQKTAVKLELAANALKQIAKSGRKILFVATKKQAKDIVAERVQKINMPYVTERWPGGSEARLRERRGSLPARLEREAVREDGRMGSEGFGEEGIERVCLWPCRQWKSPYGNPGNGWR